MVTGTNATYLYHIGCPSILSFVFVENELYCVGSCMFFYPWDRRSSLLHIQLVHNGLFILNRSLETGRQHPLYLKIRVLLNNHANLVYVTF